MESGTGLTDPDAKRAEQFPRLKPDPDLIGEGRDRGSVRCARSQELEHARRNGIGCQLSPGGTMLCREHSQLFDGARRIGWNCGSQGSDFLATVADTSDAGAHLRQLPKSLQDLIGAARRVFSNEPPPPFLNRLIGRYGQTPQPVGELVRNIERWIRQASRVLCCDGTEPLSPSRSVPALLPGRTETLILALENLSRVARACVKRAAASPICPARVLTSSASFAATFSF